MVRTRDQSALPQIPTCMTAFVKYTPRDTYFDPHCGVNSLFKPRDFVVQRPRFSGPFSLFPSPGITKNRRVSTNIDTRSKLTIKGHNLRVFVFDAAPGESFLRFESLRPAATWRPCVHNLNERCRRTRLLKNGSTSASRTPYVPQSRTNLLSRCLPHSAQRDTVPNRNQTHAHPLVLLQKMIELAQAHGRLVLHGIICNLAVPQRVVEGNHTANTH